MRKILIKLFPWIFEDWEQTCADKVRKLNNLFNKVVNDKA